MGMVMTVCLVYLDDILVQSKTFDEPDANLKLMPQRLQKATLKLAPDKSCLFQRKVTYVPWSSWNGIASGSYSWDHALTTGGLYLALHRL